MTKDSSWLDRSGVRVSGLRPSPRMERPRDRTTLAKRWPRLPVMPAMRMSMLDTGV